MTFRSALLVGLVGMVCVAACGDDDGYEPGEELAGDEAATSFDPTSTALSRPAPALEGLRRDDFFVGNSIFNRNWVSAPGSAVGVDGLGPTFNAVSCSSCHFLDGRGRPPLPGERMLSALVRLSVPGDDGHGGPLGEPSYGGQLNPASILGVPAEGDALLTWTEVAGSFADGTAYSLRQPTITFDHLAFGPMAAGTMTSLRVAPQMSGLGLLELVPEADLLARVDADDADRDGISGRANQVWDVEAGVTRPGRFGWKANQPSLRQQSAGAFVGDIGITSPVFKDQNCPPAQRDCSAAPSGDGDDGVEVNEQKLREVVYYEVTLSAPARRGAKDADILRGKRIFGELGCDGCHTPVLHTGDSAEFPELSNLTIRPFTYFLLHDMGDGLADGRPDYLADGREWRTPPLWGIGLFQKVNNHTNYLHDGRARDLTEAVLWHGGEAEASRDAFRKRSSQERADLLRFLGSL